jgi:hypothetical protein
MPFSHAKPLAVVRVMEPSVYRPTRVRRRRRLRELRTVQADKPKHRQEIPVQRASHTKFRAAVETLETRQCLSGMTGSADHVVGISHDYNTDVPTDFPVDHIPVDSVLHWSIQLIDLDPVYHSRPGSNPFAIKFDLGQFTPVAPSPSHLLTAQVGLGGSFDYTTVKYSRSDFFRLFIEGYDGEEEGIATLHDYIAPTPGAGWSRHGINGNTGGPGTHGGSTAPGNSNGTIPSDPPIKLSGRNATASHQRPSTHVVATLLDPDPHASSTEYRATVNWGDNTPPTAGVIHQSGQRSTVSGIHHFAQPGSYLVTTTVVDTTTSAETETRARVTVR